MKIFVKVLAVIMAFVMAVMTAACVKPSHKTNPQQPTGAPSPQKPTDNPNSAKDDLVIALWAEPKSLDPYATTDSPAGYVQRCIYETLTTLGDNGEILPGLAESWEIKDDITYVFHLRKGVKFHNGEELTANDVAYSFSKIAASPHAVAQRATIDFENSKALDKYTFEMKMSEPFGLILYNLNHVVMAIVNEKAYSEAEADKGVSHAPCGTGPYKFVSWTAGDKVELTAFDGYWGGLPKIKRITWRTIPESATRTVEIEAGTCDITMNLAPSEIDRLSKNTAIKISRSAAPSIDFIAFNNTMPPFDNVKVRQAINMAVNKEAIQKIVFHNTGEIARAPMSPVVWGFNDQLKPIPFDPEGAKALLAEAGYPDGFKMTIAVEENQQRHDIAEMFQEMLIPLNITVAIAPMERGAFIDKVIAGELECFVLGWNSGMTPDGALYDSFHSSNHGAGGNMSFYTNERVDELLRKSRISLDSEVRLQAYLEVQEIVWDEAPCVFLHCPENLLAYSANLKDFGLDLNGYMKITEFYF